jgi:hypothetical protein
LDLAFAAVVLPGIGLIGRFRKNLPVRSLDASGPRGRSGGDGPRRRFDGSGEAFGPIRLPKGRLPPECTQVNGIGGIAFPGTVR